jgi:hypothetical protein
MDRANSSVVVAGYIKVAPKDREAFVKVLQAPVPPVAILGRPRQAAPGEIATQANTGWVRIAPQNKFSRARTR